LRHPAPLVAARRHDRLLAPARGRVRSVGDRARRQRRAPAHAGDRQQRERGLGPRRPPPRLLVVPHGAAAAVPHARGRDRAARHRPRSRRGVEPDVVAAPPVMPRPATQSQGAGGGRAKLTTVAEPTGVRQKRVALPDVAATYCRPPTWYVTMPP